MSKDGMNEHFYQDFKKLSCNSQLDILEKLLKLSSAEVKYSFAFKTEEITKYDIISELPVEIVEKIFLYLSLSSLLKCRQVSQTWNDRLKLCDTAWMPHLREHCIDVNGFRMDDECCKRTKKHKLNFLTSDEDLNIIGERLFELNTCSPLDIQNTMECSSQIPCKSNTFIMGRKLLRNLKKQVGFEHIIDHDCCGSNVVMTMNGTILAYAREDRHIVVKYTDFPHKKISVFEAHQCADIKIYGDKLITGGYDRTICIWEWSSGTLVQCLQGSLKPVYSLDVCKDILISSDGRSVISWDLKMYSMLIKTSCFDDGHVEELKIVEPTRSSQLNKLHGQDLLLFIVRSNKSIKVATCDKKGVVEFFNPNLVLNEDVTNLQPFIQFHEDTIACSSDVGILVWSMVDFTLIKHIKRNLCDVCQYSFRADVYSRANNCRAILLYYSESLFFQYFVHLNRFQLFGTRADGKVKLSWNFPSDEKWPWSHRKPGLASSVLNMTNGFSMTTKITMFVATQGKKIYCMLFDASDYSFETKFPRVESNYDPLLDDII